MTTPLNKRKILIIEDDNDIRQFLQEEIGVYFEVEVAADGISGFEKATTYDADLIICDVLMPGMTGFELTKKLKNGFCNQSYTDNFVDGIEFCGKTLGRY